MIRELPDFGEWKEREWSQVATSAKESVRVCVQKKAAGARISNIARKINKQRASLAGRA